MHYERADVCMHNIAFCVFIRFLVINVSEQVHTLGAPLCGCLRRP